MVTPAERLQRARERAGYSSAKEAAEAMGVPVSTYICHENGSRGLPSSKAARYGRFFRTAPEWLLYGRGEGELLAPELKLVPNFLPVRYRVQAGHWIETDDYAQTYVGEFSYPVAPDARYSDWPQWLEEVVGDSVDKRIPAGGMAHVVDAIEMGYAPRDGDFVVVERRRSGGSLRERTIKQIEMTTSGPVLWPRSNNPKWSDPVKLNGGHEGEDIEVEIMGLVIGAYSVFT